MRPHKTPFHTKPRQRKIVARRPRIHFMTICATALAARSRAIVCVADKAITFGDVISWDSDVTKIVALGHPGAVAMMSGAVEGTSRVLAALSAESNLGAIVPEIKASCERIYRECVQELIEQKFLAPNLLTRDLYQRAAAARQANSIIESIRADISRFDIDCDFIICGFDSHQSPFILDLK